MAKLGLSDWANVAEIGAAIGVVISLIFVGLELRGNTEATQAATREAINQKDMAYLSLRLDSSVLAEAHTKKDNGEALSPLEDAQLVHQEYVNFVSFEHSYYQYRKGALEAEEWSRHKNIVRLQIEDNSQAREMWRQKRHTFTRPFQELVDSYYGSIARATDSEESLIHETYKAWVEASNAKDIEKWSAFLAEDPYFSPADGPPLTSTDEVIGYYKRSFDDPWFSLDCEQEHVEVSQSGRMAWSRGICHATFTGPDGKKASGRSWWFKVWTKQSGGSWRGRVNAWKYID